MGKKAMKVYLSSNDAGGYDAHDERLWKDDQEIELSDTEFARYQQDVTNYYSWQVVFDDKLRTRWYEEMKQHKPDYRIPF